MSPSQYSSSRHRIWLPVVLLGIFGATVGLAAWVRQIRLSSPIVQLATANLGVFTVQVPAEWEYLRGPKSDAFPGNWPGAFMEGKELQGHGRVLEVSQQLVSPGVSISRFLATSYGLKNTEYQPITIAGEPGALTVLPAGKVPPTETAAGGQVLAGVVLRDGIAIVVRLTIPGAEAGDNDLALVRQITGSIRPVDRNSPPDGFRVRP